MRLLSPEANVLPIPLAERIGTLLLVPPYVLPLGLLTGLPMLFAAWLLLSPELVLSRQSVTDLLFNLAGAWQFNQGHIQHIDFHEPVSRLNFLLTQIGFRIAGIDVLFEGYLFHRWFCRAESRYCI